jgi:hypothetical protein
VFLAAAFATLSLFASMGAAQPMGRLIAEIWPNSAPVDGILPSNPLPPTGVPFTICAAPAPGDPSVTTSAAPAPGDPSVTTSAAPPAGDPSMTTGAAPAAGNPATLCPNEIWPNGPALSLPNGIAPAGGSGGVLTSGF